jgi:hypothetical protein
MEKHPDKDIWAEEYIPYQDETGKNRYIRLDLGYPREEKVFIKDYKPIDLSKFEKTEVGSNWAEWMQKNVGADFRLQILNGLNPFAIQETGNAMPIEIRHTLRDFLREQNQIHEKQLEKYKSIVAKVKNIPIENIEANVRPYWKYS